MTPSKRFETIGSKPAARESPKRRLFAAIIKAPETRPFRPCKASIFQRKKTRDCTRGRVYAPFARCGPAPTVFKLKLDLKLNRPHWAIIPPLTAALLLAYSLLPTAPARLYKRPAPE